MEEFVLDIGRIEEDFFEDAQLFGIQTSMSSNKLCWLLEKRLGICFDRKLLDDIAADRFNEIPVNNRMGTLFEDMEGDAEDVFFQVFRHRPTQTSFESMFLYSNHESGYSLLPEYKNYDFFILLKDKSYRLENQPLGYWLNAIPELSFSVQELDLSKLNNKMHLII